MINKKITTLILMVLLILIPSGSAGILEDLWALLNIPSPEPLTPAHAAVPLSYPSSPIIEQGQGQGNEAVISVTYIVPEVQTSDPPELAAYNTPNILKVAREELAGYGIVRGVKVILTDTDPGMSTYYISNAGIHVQPIETMYTVMLTIAQAQEIGSFAMDGYIDPIERFRAGLIITR